MLQRHLQGGRLRSNRGTKRAFAPLVAAGVLLAGLPGHTAWAAPEAPTVQAPTGAYVAYVDEDGTVWAQSLRSGTPRRILDGAGAGARVEISPDGTTLAVLAPAGVLIAPTSGGKARQVLNSRVDGAAFSPDARTLYYSINNGVGKDGVLRALDVATKATRVVVDPVGPVVDVALSSDGTRLLYTTSDLVRSSLGRIGEAHAVDLATRTDTRVGRAGDDIVDVAFGPGDVPIVSVLTGQEAQDVGAAVTTLEGAKVFPAEELSFGAVGTPDGVYAISTTNEEEEPLHVSFAPATGGTPGRVVTDLGLSAPAFAVGKGALPRPLTLSTEVSGVEVVLPEERAVAGVPTGVGVGAYAAGPGPLTLALQRRVGNAWRTIGTQRAPRTQNFVVFPVSAGAHVQLRALANGVVSEPTTLRVASRVTVAQRRSSAGVVLRGAVVGARGGRVTVQYYRDSAWRTIATAGVRSGRYEVTLRVGRGAELRVVRAADRTHDRGVSEIVRAR
ncbi:TolB family protein [Motilibacter aurantiacus]|uniref:TolB family protein n=1 Tax=Motilibacter aurantiacus TaxID=2714955 RepID=UPI00140AE0FA|nr:hypothetical protein [Motilibacter aurantiacus]NHC46964.1 hypothetical protein [Motilibacter aurantiacus]